MGKSTKSNLTAEAELDPLIDSSQSLPTRNSSFKTPLKLLVKCGLVLLAIAYAERLRLPQAIDVYIRYHEHLLTMNVDNYAKWQQQQSSVGNQAKHPQPAPEVDDHEVETPNDPYGLNPDIDSQLAPLPSTYKVFEPTDFDDDAFLKSYTCNASYGYNIQMIHRDPLMMRLENFFSSEETDHLKFIGYPLLHRSTVVGKDGGLLHQARTSSSAFLSRAHDPVVACIEQRVSALTKVPALNIEPLQVLRYIHGQKYSPHHDYFSPDSRDGSNKELERGGQRQITIFGYLNDIPEGYGGATEFPKINIKAPAKKGDAVLWYNVGPDGETDDRTLHGGGVVYKAEKWGLNIWIRQKEFH